MPGLKIIIPTTFTDPGLPVLRADPILPATGALALFDAAHPGGSEIPLVSGSAVPNLAADQAANLLAVAPAVTQGELLFAGVGAPATGVGLVERSGKGGIHTLIGSQVTTAGHGLAIRPAQAIVDYVRANPTHDLFVSLWFHATRTTNTNAAWSAASFSGAGEYLYSLSSQPTPLPGPGPNLLGYRALPGALRPDQGGAAGPVLRNAGIATYTGTPTDTGAAARNKFKAWGIGVVGVFNGVVPQVSGIFYRYYLEDLAVSGRTYAEVDAIDHALYQKEVLTPGGRYYGDTFTDPATIP